MSLTIQYAAMFFLAWAFMGISGAQAIYCMWFSGGLRDLRKSPMPLEYYALGVVFGPFNVVIAALSWLIGLGRN